MPSLQALFHDAYVRRRTITIVAALLLTAAVPFADTILPVGWSYALLAAGVILVMAVLLRQIRPGVPGTDGATASGKRADDAARPGAGLLLYLSPVILLNLVFPLISPQMAAVQVGGVQLTSVVLACSITVPWLAQAACQIGRASCRERVF